LSRENSPADNAVVDLEHARVRLRSRAGKASPESLTQELETVRSLLDQGLTIEARARLNSLLSQARNYPSLLAQARCALSIALEMRGDYRESLEAVAMYEEADARATLDANLSARLRVQIALALNYNGDHPKAITLLKATLRDLPEEGPEVGAAYVALARVYRSINEYPIARDMRSGRWRVIDKVATGADWRKPILG